MTQRNAPQIRLICWDMGNVFLPWNIQPFITTIAPYTSFPEEALDSRLMQSGLFEKFMIGECRTQFQFFAAYARLIQARPELTYEIFANAWNLIFTQNHDIEPLLARMRHNVRMVIVSNCDLFMHKHIRAHPLVKRYIPDPSNHFLSYREGYMKPDPIIFKRTFMRTGIPAKDAVLIDDMQGHIAVFEDLGGSGICWNAHIDPIAKLEKALAAHGVFR